MRRIIFLALFSLILASQAVFASTAASTHAKKTSKPTATTATHSKSRKATSNSSTSATKTSSPSHKQTTASSKHTTTTTKKSTSASGKHASTRHPHTSHSRKHTAKSRTPQGDVEAMADSEGEELTATSNDTTPTKSDNSFTHRMVAMVDDTVQNLRYSVYKLGGTHYDASKGVYMVDCSDYVDHLLHDSSPQAYTSLATWSGSYKPTSEHYYSFFTQRLAAASDPNWQKINNTQKLQPGDILVFRYKNSRGRAAGGHVMIVMDKPSGDDNVLQLRVADSAASGHGEDTRPAHTSGIGIGTMLLKVNSDTGEPYAYAWKAGAPWKSNVNFAMARPNSTA